MTSDLRIQGEVVVNSEQAESAFNRVGDKAQQMANEVATSATKAGQAVDKIGDGAGASAEKFTKAQASFRDSIIKSTQKLQELNKSASEVFEMRAANRGFDASKFAPYIEELKKAEAAQRIATGSLDKMGISAAQTAAALRGVPAQFTDIVTSLQGGQAPLTVFLQQGGQLKDMFGGAGAAARALGGYVVGLINPFTVAAAAGVALALAYKQGSAEADAYNKALITTGNAAGTNAAQLKAYAQEISAVVGTQGKAAESLAALASTGKIGAESLKEAAQAAVQYERATGQAVEKTAEQFASLRNEPLAAVLKLNDGMNFLTDSTYKQIKSLEEQGKTAEAANVAQRAFADTLSGRAGEMERNLGTVERGWLAVKDAAKSAWDAILNVGRASTNVDQLAAVRKQIADRENQLANGGFGANGGGAAFGRPSQAATERLRAELSALQAQAAALEGVANQSRVAAEEERKRGEQVKATAAFDKAGEKFLTDKAKMERELAAARVQGAEAGKSQAEIEQRLAQIRESFAKKGSTAAENKELRDQMRVFADLAGVSSTYYTELANYQKQRANNVITEQQYVQAVEDLIKKQPFAVAIAKEQADATKAQAKASEEAAKAHLKYVESFGKGAAAAQQQADQLRTEEAAAAIAADGYYSLAQAIELVTIARLEEQQQGLLGNEEAYLAVQKEIDARKELVGLIGSKEARKAAEDSAKDAAREWDRAAADINRSLTDALLRGFESGKDFAQNLRDTIKNMFSTLVLRPVISAVLSPVSGALGSMFGGAGGAGGGGIGSAMNLASLGSNALSLYNGGLAGWVGSGVGSIFGTAAGNAALGTTLGLGSSSSIAAANAASLAGGGNGVLGMGASGTAGTSALAGAGAFAAVAAVVLNALGAFKSERKVGGGLMGTLGSGSISPWEEWREGGTLFSGPSYSTMNPVAELARARERLASLQASSAAGTLGNPQVLATQQLIVDQLEATYGGLADATAQQSKVIQTAYDAMRKSAGDMADTLGLSSDAARKFTTQLGGEKGLNFDGLNAEQQQAKVAEALATANNELAQQVIGTWETTSKEVSRVIATSFGSAEESGMVTSWETLTDTITQTRYVASEYAKDGEKAIDTLTRLASSLSTVNTIWDQLGNDMLQASLAGADAASRIAEAFGGLEAMSATTGSYFQNFYGADEQRDAMRRQIQGQLDKLNLTLPDIDAANAREQYRALAEAQDRNTEEGLKAYVALLQLSGAFASLTQAAQTTTQTLEQQRQAYYGALQDAVSARNKSLQSQLSAAQEVESTLDNLFGILRSNVRELYGEVDGTRGMLASQGSAFIDQALAAAKASGYLPDADKLAEAISAVRGGIDGGAYTSQFASDRDRLVLAGKLSGLEGIAEKQLTDAQKTVRALETQIDQNEQVLDNWRQAIDIANGTYQGVLSVESAIQQLSGSLGLSGNTKPATVSGGSGGGGVVGPGYRDRGTVPRVAYGADEALTSFEKFEAWFQGLMTNAPTSLLQSDAYKVPDWMRMAGFFGTGSESDTLGSYLYLKNNSQFARDLQQIMTTGVSSLPTDGSTLVRSDLSKMPADAAEFFKNDRNSLLSYESFGLDPVLAYKLYKDGPGQFGLDIKRENFTEWLRTHKWTDGGVVSANNTLDTAKPYAGYNLARYDNATGNIVNLDGTIYSPDGKYLGMAGRDLMASVYGSAFLGTSGGSYGDATRSALYNSQVQGGATEADYYAKIKSGLDDAMAQGKTAQDIADAISSTGASMQDVAAAYGLTVAELEANLRAKGATNIPKFDIGTNYVPRDMLAYIHEGEAVVPKAYNPAAGGGGAGGNAELVAEVRALREAVAALQAAADETAGNTRLMPQMGRQFDQVAGTGRVITRAV